MPLFLRAAVALIAASLCTCSSLSQKQCLSENWHAIGERDGANGHTEYRITDHQETCAKYGIVPDMPEHEAGRQEGLKRYCTAVGGLQAGRYANSYAGVCEAENEDAFLAGFKLGQDIYDMELRVNAVRSEYDLARNRLADIDRSRREQDRETNSDGKRRERDALRLRLRELERDLWRADDDLRQLEWAARRMR